jgi:hypothetical protein
MGLAKSQQSLKNWTDQKWMTSGTHANKKRGSSKEVKANGKKRYLPEAAWDSLSSGEKAATNKAKAKGNSKGKQFVSQPKGIKEKTKSFRKFGGANNNKSEIMKSMYKKGGKPSKKKVMKEAKKEGESFMVENKELSFGAPQMRKGGVKKYEDGGPGKGKMTAAEVRADMKSRASKPNPVAEMQNKVKADKQNKMTEAVKNKVRDDMNEDWRYNSWGADAYDAMSLGTGNFNYDVYDSKLPEVAKKAASKKTGGAKSMEPGGGGRFAKMVSGLKKEGKSEDSAKAIAASIGRKKYGKSKFQAMAAAGKKRMGGKKC